MMGGNTEVAADVGAGVLVEGERGGRVLEEDLGEADLDGADLRHGVDDRPRDEMAAPGQRIEHDLSLGPHGGVPS